MRAGWSAALAALVVTLAAGCSPDIPTEGGTPPGVYFLDLTGDWVYSAPEVRLVGADGPAPCKIVDARLTLEQIRGAGAFEGRSTGGQLTCRGELAMLSGPLTAFPIVTGYTFNQFVSFDFGSPDWRHDGLVVSADDARIDSMSGSFQLRNGGGLFEGTFRAVRAAGR